MFFLTKVWNVSSKKTELPFMRLNSDAKFEEKLTCGMENVMENLTKFHQRIQSQSQNWDIDVILLSKVEKV